MQMQSPYNSYYLQLSRWSELFFKTLFKKMLVNRYPYFIMRMMLAAIDHNMHLSRGTKMTEDGEERSSPRGPRDTMLSRSKRKEVTAISLSWL